MRFNPKARLDTSQIDNRTGGGGGGGGGFPGLGGGGLGGGGLGGGRMGGGIGGLVLILILVFVLPKLLGGSDGGSGSGEGQATDFSTCTSGQSANDSQACRLVAVTNSVNEFWSEEFPQETGKQYVGARTVPFTGQVRTGGCGTASSDVGPFYCPNDQRVYLDLTFFHDMLQGQLGAKGGDFSEAYVVAHEYGHHIENLMGIMSQVRTQQGQNSDSVKLELMADCLAGAWTKHATETKDADGQVLITDITQADIADAIDAANAVGDDRIQKRSSGRVNPEVWTHGSAQQRVQAFNRGLDAGTIRGCNYFG